MLLCQSHVYIVTTSAMCTVKNSRQMSCNHGVGGDRLHGGDIWDDAGVDVSKSVDTFELYKANLSSSKTDEINKFGEYHV